MKINEFDIQINSCNSGKIVTLSTVKYSCVISNQFDSIGKYYLIIFECSPVRQFKSIFSRGDGGLFLMVSP